MISTRILRHGGCLREDDGANEWERCFHVSWSTRNPLQMWIMTQRLKTHQRTFRISPNPRAEARRNSVRQREEQFENLPGDLQLTKACDDAGFTRNVSPGQLLQAHVENICKSRNDKRSEPKGFIRGHTRSGLALEDKITKHFDRHGIEITINSTQKDGTQSWIVISRSIEKYVTELSEENKKPILHEEASSSTGKPVAMKPK